jgi:hypothetical protein
VGVTFLQDREERINGLFADLKKAAPEDPDTLQRKWNELTVLLREYSDEIAQRGVSRRDETRVLALLDKQHESRGEMPSIERFEVIALLRVFAADAIKDGRDKHEDMKAFMNEWDVNHRGIMVKVVVMSGWMLARDDVLGKPFG